MSSEDPFCRSKQQLLLLLPVTLKSGAMGTGGRGQKYTSGVRGRSFGGVWGRRSQMYTDSLQLSNAFLRRFVAESVLYLPTPRPKKRKLRICANPMTQLGCDRVSTCLLVATLQAITTTFDFLFNRPIFLEYSRSFLVPKKVSF